MDALVRAPVSPRVAVGGWAAAFRAAATIAITRPSLWTLGLLGFLARGGALLVLLPITALPSPVGLSTLLGPDLFDADGLSARGQALLELALAVVAILVILALLLSAASDSAAFGSFAADPRSAPLRRGRGARRLDVPTMAWLVIELALLRALLLVPAALAVVGAATRVSEVARQEILLPTRLDLPLTVRVAAGSLGPLVLMGALLLLASIVSGRLGRELLLGRFGLERRVGWRASLLGAMVIGTWRLVRRPGRFLAAEAIGWTVALPALALALAALAVAWRLVETMYLAGGPARATPLPELVAGVAGALGAALATVAFLAVFGLALAVLGAASALRAALLTTAVLPGPRREDWTHRGD